MIIIIYIYIYTFLYIIKRKAHRGPQRCGSIGPSIRIVMGVFNLFYIQNTRSNRSTPSWPTMCFSSHCSEPFELGQILHSHYAHLSNLVVKAMCVLKLGVLGMHALVFTVCDCARV